MKIDRKLTIALIMSVVILGLTSAAQATYKKNKGTARNSQFISKTKIINR
jgi:hypothetical protein